MRRKRREREEREGSAREELHLGRCQYIEGWMECKVLFSVWIKALFFSLFISTLSLTVPSDCIFSCLSSIFSVSYTYKVIPLIVVAIKWHCNFIVTHYKKKISLYCMYYNVSI